MEFTELTDYPIPDGLVTEWVPTVTRPDQWSADSRPLAYTHEAHCRFSLAQADTDGGASWIGAAFEIHERYDATAVGRALTSWTARHETFRTTVATEPGVTADASSIPLVRSTVPAAAVHVASHTDGVIRTGAQIQDHLTRYFGRRLSPFEWPHCLVATVTDVGAAPDRFLLVFGADHSVMDAYSMLLAVSELRRLYEFELRGVDPRLTPIGSHVDFSVGDRRTGDDLGRDHPAVHTWSRFLDDHGFPSFPLPVQSHAGAGRQSSVSTWMLSERQTTALAHTCRTAGRSMTAAVLGALALANHDATGAPRLRLVMPMHTRYEAQYAQSVGWYVGVVPVDVGVDVSRTFEGSLDVAAEALAAVDGYAGVPYSRVAELLAIDSVPRFVVSYLDLRHTPDADLWSQWRARTLRSATVADDEVYFWILRTPLGLNVSARFPDNEIATHNVGEFLARLGAILADVAGPDCSDGPVRAPRRDRVSVGGAR